MKQLYESLGISKEVYEYGEGILEGLRGKKFRTWKRIS